MNPENVHDLCTKYLAQGCRMAKGTRHEFNCAIHPVSSVFTSKRLQNVCACYYVCLSALTSCACNVPWISIPSFKILTIYAHAIKDYRACTLVFKRSYVNRSTWKYYKYFCFDFQIDFHDFHVAKSTKPR